MAKYEAGFIGAGNMGGALALAAAKKTGGDRIAVACSTRERSGAAAQRLGCTAETPQRILSDSRFVFLGVKPQMVVGVVEGLKADILASEGIFVSMLAGVSLEKLALLLGADKKIIRIMPNTPCAVGQGLILYAANGRVSEDELCAFRELMAPAGALDELNEHLIDAASAVSGCGPAYVYLFLDALANGGVACGLRYDQALALAAQTLIGAAGTFFIGNFFNGCFNFLEHRFHQLFFLVGDYFLQLLVITLLFGIVHILAFFIKIFLLGSNFLLHGILHTGNIRGLCQKHLVINHANCGF